MAVKIYNNGANAVFEETGNIRDYNCDKLTYNIKSGVVTFFYGISNQRVEQLNVSDVQNKSGGTFATDLLLSEYLSNFLAENNSLIIQNPNIFGVLGQSNPSATTLTTLYTVPSGKQINELSGIVCNRSNLATSFRIAIRPNGASISNEHYIYYDVAIGGNDTFYFDYRIRISDTDVVSVYANDATLSFSIFGEELNIL